MEEIVYSNIQTKCTGTCDWTWWDSQPGFWEKYFDDCSSGCSCAQPSSDGTFSGDNQSTTCA